MDARRFSTEPWMASRKIPVSMNQQVCSVGEEPFFGYFLDSRHPWRSPLWGRLRRSRALLRTQWLCKESSSPKVVFNSEAGQASSLISTSEMRRMTSKIKGFRADARVHFF